MSFEYVYNEKTNIGSKKPLIYYLLVGLFIILLILIIIYFILYLYKHYFKKNIVEISCQDSMEGESEQCPNIGIQSIKDKGYIFPSKWQYCTTNKGSQIPGTDTMYVNLDNIEGTDGKVFEVFKLTEHQCGLLNEVYTYDKLDSFKILRIWKEIDNIKEDIQQVLFAIMDDNISWECEEDLKKTKNPKCRLAMNTINSLQYRLSNILDNMVTLNKTITDIEGSASGGDKGSTICNLYTDCNSKFFDYFKLDNEESILSHNSNIIWQKHPSIFKANNNEYRCTISDNLYYDYYHGNPTNLGKIKLWNPTRKLLIKNLFPFPCGANNCMFTRRYWNRVGKDTFNDFNQMNGIRSHIRSFNFAKIIQHTIINYKIEDAFTDSDNNIITDSGNIIHATWLHDSNKNIDAFTNIVYWTNDDKLKGNEKEVLSKTSKCIGQDNITKQGEETKRRCKTIIRESEKNTLNPIQFHDSLNPSLGPSKKWGSIIKWDNNKNSFNIDSNYYKANEDGNSRYIFNDSSLTSNMNVNEFTFNYAIVLSNYTNIVNTVKIKFPDDTGKYTTDWIPVPKEGDYIVMPNYNTFNHIKTKMKTFISNLNIKNKDTFSVGSNLNLSLLDKCMTRKVTESDIENISENDKELLYLCYQALDMKIDTILEFKLEINGSEVNVKHLNYEGGTYSTKDNNNVSYRRVKLGKKISMDIYGLHQEIEGSGGDKPTFGLVGTLFGEFVDWIKDGFHCESCESWLKMGSLINNDSNKKGIYISPNIEDSRNIRRGIIKMNENIYSIGDHNWRWGKAMNEWPGFEIPPNEILGYISFAITGDVPNSVNKGLSTYHNKEELGGSNIYNNACIAECKGNPYCNYSGLRNIKLSKISKIKELSKICFAKHSILWTMFLLINNEKWRQRNKRELLDALKNNNCVNYSNVSKPFENNSEKLLNEVGFDNFAQRANLVTTVAEGISEGVKVVGLIASGPPGWKAAITEIALSLVYKWMDNINKSKCKSLQINLETNSCNTNVECNMKSSMELSWEKLFSDKIDCSSEKKCS